MVKDLSEILSSMAVEMRTRNELNDRVFGILDKVIASRGEEAARIAAAVTVATEAVAARNFKLDVFLIVVIALLAGLRVAELLHLVG